MSELATYSRFFSREEAEEFGALLQKEGVYCKVEHEKDILDKIYIGETLDPLFALKIDPADFQKANSVSKVAAESQLSDINSDYYLFSFNNEELKDVLNHPHEWNAFDQALAAKLLKERNVDFVATPPQQKTEYVFTPIKVGPAALVLEYVCSIIFLYVGILVGLATLLAFKTLPDGKKVKLFDSKTRQHGKIILAIGIISLLILLVFHVSLFIYFVYFL